MINKNMAKIKAKIHNLMSDSTIIEEEESIETSL